MEIEKWEEIVVELAFDLNSETGECRLKPYPQIVEDSFEAGVRQVMDFLRDNCYVQNIKGTGAWQAKLKEWGR